MSVTNKFLDYVIDHLKEVQEKQLENIDKAAKLVADSYKKGGTFYVFGSGHSHLVAEEIYMRAGGVAFVKAILPPELMLHERPLKSTYLERLEGYGEALLKLYKPNENDVIMIISNSGRNAVPVEMCLNSKARGTKTIVLTSLSHSTKVASRHSSGKNLYQIGDVVLDNCAVPGDAGFYIDGVEAPVGPTSDIAGTTIAQAIICEAVNLLAKDGIIAPIFKSSNGDNQDAYNDVLFETHYGSFK